MASWENSPPTLEDPPPFAVHLGQTVASLQDSRICLGHHRVGENPDGGQVVVPIPRSLGDLRSRAGDVSSDFGLGLRSLRAGSDRCAK